MTTTSVDFANNMVSSTLTFINELIPTGELIVTVLLVVIGLGLIYKIFTTALKKLF